MSKAKRVDARPNIADLSFVGERKKPEAGKLPRCFWRVTPSGDYGADCELGQRLALEYLAFQEAADGSSLQHIVADMPRELTGVEVGFLTMVSFAAGGGAYRARQIAAYWDECARARA
jgi:hypothetical protein